jgi:hypothetical protein
LVVVGHADRKERGSPKCGSTLVSKRVMAQILVSLKVNTVRPSPGRFDITSDGSQTQVTVTHQGLASAV